MPDAPAHARDASEAAMPAQSARQSKPLPALALAAIGVVFGDVGTNPLYALRQVFHDTPDYAQDKVAILGVVSLMLWSVILVVCVKYVTFVMRADHDGEGGTLAMLGLLHSREKQDLYRLPGALTLLVLFGSALLYGDGMVTPAISVLSAVEGLDVATDTFKPYVVEIAAAILAILFAVQSRGTETIGRAFGPVMVVWFVTIGALGAVSIVGHPAILAAFNPEAGLAFLFGHGWTGYATLGSVVLAFAGAEALFADLGHFGRQPITLAWYCLVLPGLALNYLGQAAAVIADPKLGPEPFYGLVPHWGLYPMVLLATVATVIASQALISGAFSLTQQAVSMGFAPRYAIKHTSPDERGQVFMPLVNWFLAIGCLAIVFGFRSSDALGAAYGLAVIGTMTITSIVFYLVMRRIWGWGLARAVPLTALFLVIELAFLIANLAKLFSGAWVPLVIGFFVFVILAVWTDGNARRRRALREWSMPVADFQATMRGWESRSEGTGVFLTSDLDRVPLVGKHEWMRKHIGYERVLLLKVVTTKGPFVRGKRVEVEDCGDGLYRATAWFGFMERVRVRSVLPEALPFAWDGVAFYLPQPLETETGSLLVRLRRKLFLLLGRTGLTPVEYFEIPPHLAISVGLELEI